MLHPLDDIRKFIDEMIRDSEDLITHNRYGYHPKHLHRYRRYISKLTHYFAHPDLRDLGVPFSDTDPRWLYAVYIALINFFTSRKQFYRIALPSESYTYDLAEEIIIFGDAGTNDVHLANLATAIDAQQVKQCIHLGDIYYAGTKEECRTFATYLPRTETWSLIGNHEYISAGQGFFEELIDGHHLGGGKQVTSFFALANPAHKILLVGLDTGYKCENFVLPPGSEEMDYDTHLDRAQHQWLTRCYHQHPDYQIVVLTHHQPCAARWKDQQFNTKLVEQVYQGRDIKLWIAGHDHHCVVYPHSYGPINQIITIGHATMPSHISSYPPDNGVFTIDRNAIPSALDEWHNGGFIKMSLATRTLTFYEVSREDGSWKSYYTLPW